MNKQQIEKFFPNLSTSPYSITSPPDKGYNCIAWAAGDTDVWWEPDSQYTCFWPDSIPRIYTIEAYVKAFESVGFIRCQDACYENGFEKVAIYVFSDGKPAHAARQLGSGVWTSKLGLSEDIEHGKLEALEGQIYGIVSVILKRQIRP